MLSLFIRYLSAFLFGICPPEPVYICLRATPHVLHLIIQRSPKSWPEAQSHLCEFLTICICDCLHNKRDRLHVCFIRKIWLAYGIPNIYGFFYTTAIWGQEFLHLKVRIFATKLCVKFYFTNSVKHFFCTQLENLALFFYKTSLWWLWQISSMMARHIGDMTFLIFTGQNWGIIKADVEVAFLSRRAQKEHTNWK